MNGATTVLDQNPGASSIRSFYPMDAATTNPATQHGAIGSDYNCCYLYDGTNCPGLVNAGSAITSKVAYIGTKAGTAPANTPAVLTWNNDFILAATF